MCHSESLQTNLCVLCFPFVFSYTFPNKVWWTCLLRVDRYFTSMCQNSSNFILHSTSVELICRTLSLLICLWYITWESWIMQVIHVHKNIQEVPRSTTKNYYIIINFFIKVLHWQLLQKKCTALFNQCCEPSVS